MSCIKQNSVDFRLRVTDQGEMIRSKYNGNSHKNQRNAKYRIIRLQRTLLWSTPDGLLSKNKFTI